MTYIEIIYVARCSWQKQIISIIAYRRSIPATTRETLSDADRRQGYAEISKSKHICLLYMADVEKWGKCSRCALQATRRLGTICMNIVDIAHQKEYMASIWRRPAICLGESIATI